MVLRLPMALAFVLGFAITAAGQNVITLNPIEISGQVVETGRNRILVKAADGSNWILNLQNGTRLKITGTAGPDVLKPGMCVRFTASINKHTCKAQDKIEKLTIFTPTTGIAERTLGVEKAQDHPQGDDDDSGPGGFMPVAPPPGGVPPGFGPGRRPGQAAPRRGPMGPADAGITEEAPPGGKAPNRRGTNRKPDASVPDVASYDVCAQVVSFHGRRLIVNVPNRFFRSRIFAELAEDAQIGLDVSILSLVKRGDQVSAKGYYATKGMCEAGSVHVTLAKPVGKVSHRPRTAAHEPEAAHLPTPKAGRRGADKKTPPQAVVEEKEAPAATTPPAGAAPPEVQNPIQSPDLKPSDKKPPLKDDEKDVFEK